MPTAEYLGRCARATRCGRSTSRDAYHHIGIHEDDQRYFTFEIETGDGPPEYFSTSALNFGWCRSPQIFTEVW